MLDTPYSVVGLCAQIVAAGHGAVIRYISPDSKNFPNKRLTASEVTEMQANGIAVLGVWEVEGDLAEMTTETGAEHANAAVAVYQSLGFPAGQGIAIAFAVDFDPDDDDKLDAVGNYVRAIHPIVSAAGYLVMGYLCGAGLALYGIAGEGLIHYRWLPNAPDWNGTEAAIAAQAYEILQRGSTTCAGIPVDIDDHLADLQGCGFWVASPHGEGA